MRNFYKIIIFSIALLSFFPTSQASVVSPTPQCTMNIDIISSDNVSMLGQIVKLKSDSFFSFLHGPFCKTLKNKKIRITGMRKKDKARLAGVSYLKLGVQEYSSNGTLGAFRGKHWDIIKMEIGEAGLVVNPMKYPVLQYELLDN